MMDLDFDTDGDGDVDDTDALAHSYPNWTPIGTAASPFTATFKGNLTNDVMPKIYNLTITSISGSASADAGLFGATNSTARIEGVALVDANVNIDTSAHSHLNPKIGALVGYNSGDIIACYSTGAIEVTAGAGSYAGGLVGYNTGTIAAAFSRATVDIKMAAGVTGPGLNIYAGGLAGHNEGTLTATYAAGAVKGKAGGGYVGGLVGFNTPADGAPSGTKTIIASYSIAPVTSVPYATTDNAPKPTIGGLTGCCNDATTTTTITASYWDYITSDIDDESPTTMPQGKSTSDLMAPASATGIYTDWDDLTIDSANDVDPWSFSGTSEQAQRYPLLEYGGHTPNLAGNQHFALIGNPDRSRGSTERPGEGMTLNSSLGGNLGGFIGHGPGGLRYGAWVWETSTDGIAWSNDPVSSTICGVHHGRICGPSYRAAGATYRFVPRPEHVGKYIRAKVGLTTGDYLYTRVIGKIKAASTNAPLAMSFASGNNPPRVGTAITVASPTTLTVVGLWQRCDTKGSNGSSPSGCDYVGSLPEYTPGVDDLNHFLRAYIYYKDDGKWKRTSLGFIREPVADARRNTWR